ncbi:hypothetical protein [Bradyrhizobium sp.]|uniref:hypothetical protein n=1 Tax=Bradyrhizobium sp. TaxID=376 RepID=UPI001EB9B5F4|nr:hypothetical protein [Bradyrhizobium sp.]MBV8921453.1 hypothetical protein [Bradyrhizobium sp.]MBV9984002.1 hypothetical protein [Bradyrhizobium sp.]
MSKTPVDPRTVEMIRTTKEIISEQIEIVAKAVCEGGEIERAMRVLEGLAKRLALLEMRGLLPLVVKGPSQGSAPPSYMQSPSSVPTFDE